MGDRPGHRIDRLRATCAIGEGSPFHETFGYYAHGVGPETAKPPAGWEARLVRVRNDNTRGAVGLCLEPHDLVLSKCVAGREKDWNFARLAVAGDVVDMAELARRAADLPLSDESIEAIRRMLGGLA